MRPESRQAMRTSGKVVWLKARPETILGDTGVAVHPDDDRYTPLDGELIVTPLGVAVPLRLHELAEPDKGTGVAMVCTFGLV